LVEIHYPQAKRIHLVLDNLDTHTPAQKTISIIQ